MFQTQSRLLASHCGRQVPADVISTSARYFSISRLTSNSATQPNRQEPLTSRAPRTHSPISAPKRANNPKNVTPRRTLPQRVVDARSLAVPRDGSLPTKILRSPRFQKARNGAQSRGRRTTTPTAVTSRGRKGDKPKVPRKRTDMEEIDESSQAEIEDVYVGLSKTSTSVASRYTPQSVNLSTLDETWPSLPINIAAKKAGVVEKLSWLSDRFPNGYIPPYELGKRLFEGQSVRFYSEEEKSLALSEAQKFAQRRADTLSQRKGNLVEPEDVIFKEISEGNKSILIEKLVRGNYTKLETRPVDKPHVLDDVLKNLRNNETYRSAGKGSQFVTKVETLLASSRPSPMRKA